MLYIQYSLQYFYTVSGILGAKYIQESPSKEIGDADTYPSTHQRISCTDSSGNTWKTSTNRSDWPRMQWSLCRSNGNDISCTVYGESFVSCVSAAWPEGSVTSEFGVRDMKTN